MSKWIEKFNGHPFLNSWSSLLELIQDDTLDEETNEDSVQDLARLRKVILYLNGIVKNIDPELMPVKHMDTLQSQSQSCLNELNAFMGNGNIGNLQNSNNHADQLLISFNQIPASIYSISKDNISAAVSGYSETIGSYINRYKNETDEGVSELEVRVTELNEKIKEKERKLEELKTSLNGVSQTIQKQTSEFNTQYQASEQSRTEKFDKIYEKYVDESDDEFKNLSTKASKIIEILVKLQDDASQVYGVTVNTLQGGAYSSYANDERRTANWLRITASTMMLMAVGFLVIPELYLMFDTENYKFIWQKVLGRVPLSLVVFVPAFYFARESGKHRNNEVTNRRRQHILSTLDPYIELMDTDKAQDLKSHVAKTIFSEVNTTTENNAETSNILSQLANLAKQIKRN